MKEIEDGLGVKLQFLLLLVAVLTDASLATLVFSGLWLGVF